MMTTAMKQVQDVSKLPRKWKDGYLDVLKLSDAERKARKLSSNQTIIEILGWGPDGVKDGLEEVTKMASWARQQHVITMDSETGAKEEYASDDWAALDPYKGKIVLFQVGNEERQYLIWWDTISEEAKAVVMDLWMDEKVRKVGVNLKFDQRMIFGDRGMHARGANLYDTQIIEQILTAGLIGDIGFAMKLSGMGAMALRWLGIKLVKDEDVRTGWAKMLPGQWVGPRESYASDEEYEQAKVEGQVKKYYAADDLVIPVKILQCQLPWIRHFELVKTLKLEMKFLVDLAEMEVRGLPIDWDAWEALVVEAIEGYKKAQRDLDKLFNVEVTYRVDANGDVEVFRDKNYGSGDELKDLIRNWMWEHQRVDVICSNKHFKDSLAEAGMNPSRLEMLFEKKLVPNPDKPGSNMQVGYERMADYIEGSEHVPSHWLRFLPKLSGREESQGTFTLTSTETPVLKLMKIIHETPKDQIEDFPEIPTKIGLPPELVDPILALRKYGTLIQRYGYAWKDLIHPVTGRVHTDTTQAAADTGRLTTRPNFQNLPADQRYRAAACKAPAGRKIIGADWSQIEPRIIAELSQAKSYMKVFWSERPGTEGFARWCGTDVKGPLDLYGSVGADIGVLPPDAADKKIAKLPENSKGRKKSKIAVLGLGYGQGTSKFWISYLLDMGAYHPRQESDDLFNGFWAAAEEVKETLDRLSDIADPQRSKRKVLHPWNDQKVTYSETLGGRKRFYAPGAGGWWTQSRNQPVQGSGADILKHTVVELNKEYRRRKLDAFLLLTAHDELIGEAAEHCAQEAADLMGEYMSKIGQLYCPHVPITAEAYVADIWVKD